VGLDDAAAHGEPDPNAVRRVVVPREHVEDPGRLARVDAKPVVAHRHDPFLAVAKGAELDPQGGLAAVLHGVPEEVLQHAPQLPRVALDLGQLADVERRRCALQARP